MEKLTPLPEEIKAPFSARDEYQLLYAGKEVAEMFDSFDSLPEKLQKRVRQCAIEGYLKTAQNIQKMVNEMTPLETGIQSFKSESAHPSTSASGDWDYSPAHKILYLILQDPEKKERWIQVSVHDPNEEIEVDPDIWKEFTKYVEKELTGKRARSAEQLQEILKRKDAQGFEKQIETIGKDLGICAGRINDDLMGILKTRHGQAKEEANLKVAEKETNLEERHAAFLKNIKQESEAPNLRFFPKQIRTELESYARNVRDEEISRQRNMAAESKEEWLKNAELFLKRFIGFKKQAHELKEAYDRGEVLLDFGGHYNTLGRDDLIFQDYFVVGPDGKEIRSEYYETKGSSKGGGLLTNHNRRKEWDIVPPGAIALSWSFNPEGGTKHNFKVVKLPFGKDSFPTPTQQETVQRIQKELKEFWDKVQARYFPPMEGGWPLTSEEEYKKDQEKGESFEKTAFAALLKTGYLNKEALKKPDQISRELIKGNLDSELGHEISEFSLNENFKRVKPLKMENHKRKPEVVEVLSSQVLEEGKLEVLRYKYGGKIRFALRWRAK